MKKIDAGIKSKTGKHKSLLNYESAVYESDDEILKNNIEVLNSLADPNSWNANYVLEEHLEKVLSWLEQHFLPHDIERHYNVEINFINSEIKIDGEAWKTAAPSALSIDKAKRNKWSTATSKCKLDELLINYFTQFAGASSAGQFISEFNRIKHHMENGDINRAVLHSLRAMEFKTHLVIANFEDASHSQRKRVETRAETTRKGIKENFIAQRYYMLTKIYGNRIKKDYLTSMAKEIKKNLKEHENIDLGEPAVRGWLKEGRLQGLLRNYPENPLFEAEFNEKKRKISNAM